MPTNKQPLIGIIGGKGCLGAHFKAFFEDRGLKVLVTDLGTKINNIDLATKCDIIIVSVPIDIVSKIIREIRPYIPKTSALMDFTSVKEEPVREMLRAGCEVLGMHPMFGNSNPIPGQTIIICPTSKSGAWSNWLEDFFRQNGVDIVKMSAAEHDRIMSIAQGLLHFSDIVFIDSIRRTKTPINKLLQYTGKASELKIQLAARLIAQDPYLYAKIQIFNPYNARVIRENLKSFKELNKIVRKKNVHKFVEFFQANKKYLDEYTNQALADSSYLISAFIEKQRRSRLRRKIKKPHQCDIAVLGPARTFSDFAATEYLDRNNLKINKYFAHDINEVFEKVEKKEVSMGILPIENKFDGTVRETIDGLLSAKVHIISELDIPVHHSLITLPHAQKKDIQKIISHPQALQQCKKYLLQNFPRAAKIEFSSTAGAIEELIVTENVNMAVIASKNAVNTGSLKIFAENIEDNKENATRFIVIQKGEIKFEAKQPAQPPSNLSAKRLSGSYKISNLPKSRTSIAFYFSKNAPGSLSKILNYFAFAKIDLSKIESRPTKDIFGSYIFFIDFLGNLLEPRVQNTLQKIQKDVGYLKILGSYSLSP